MPEKHGDLIRAGPGAEPPFLYAVTMRMLKCRRLQPLFQSWFYPLQFGQTLPQLPIWLDTELHVMLELEASYEDTCRLLRIT